MGKTFSTGLLTNAISTNGSNNVGIGGAADATAKLKVTGAATVTGSITNNGMVFNADAGLISTDSSLSRYTNNYLYLQGVTAGGLWLSGSSARTNNIAIRNSTNEIQFDTNSATRMFITSTGNLGIGTSSPISVAGQTSLTVNGTNVGRYDIFVNGTHNAQFLSTSSELQIGSLVNIPFSFYTNGTERMRITSGPSGGGGSTLLLGTSSSIWESTNRTTIELNGNGSAILGFKVAGGERGYLFHGGTHMYLQNNTSGGALYIQSGNSGGVQLTAGSTSFAPQSDERLKNISSNIENALDKLNTLRTVSYSWKSDSSSKQHLGLIAQDVQKVLPQLIEASVRKEDPITGLPVDQTEYLSLKYTDMIPVLVKAHQEEDAKVNAQELRIQQLESQIEELKALIAAK